MNYLIPFHRIEDGLPELVDFSSSYGGQWTSERCVVLFDSGYCGSLKWTVSDWEKREFVDRGIPLVRDWESDRKRVVAWACVKEVAACLLTPHVDATPNVATVPVDPQAAWAAGYEIQYFQYDSYDAEWTDLIPGAWPSWSTQRGWRVKPGQRVKVDDSVACVPTNSVRWLQQNYPVLCEKSGLRLLP